jgi:hypothetical protein
MLDRTVAEKSADVSVTSEFPKFAKIVNKSFQDLVESTVYETGSGDALWEAYLAAFPAGTNPIFKKRTEHDCSCCKQFIRRAGTITNGIKTVWDEAAVSAPEPYKQVAKTLRDLVRSMAITNLYLVNKKEASFGTKESHSQAEGGPVITWNHFYTGEIPAKLRSDTADTVRGEYRTTTEVFERGLKELTAEAIETVLSLIAANNLYRGDEHKPAILAFSKAQKQYAEAKDKHLYVWHHATGPASRFRNSVIGTLVTDISDGKDIDAAVRAFETKVAPQNYKRTTAVITPAMIKRAMETINELGLEPALERRFAKIGDINVNDVLWVDNNVKSLMKGGLEAALMKEAKSSPADQKGEVVGLDEFLALMKDATSLEVFLEGQHLGNMVSLTAPVHADSKQLFKWDNDFSWSYTGNVADSIKERVKKAGGKVTGLMRVSLSWFNYDDLDLHIYEPEGRGYRSLNNHIYYGSKIGSTGGRLDVDMNAGGGTSREPVENVAWSEKPPDGSYKVVVNNFQNRESSNVGFVIEVESAGKVHNFSYNKAVRYKQDVHVCTLVVKDGVIVKIEGGEAGITSSLLSQNKWGVKSESFVKVNAVTLSPNFWGSNRVGNKHVFFFLDGCLSDESTRGIYNEFLHSRLETHRKVFEVIGEKTKCQPTVGQLSGLGFSSTKKEVVLVKVNNKRLYRVQTGG